MDTVDLHKNTWKPLANLWRFTLFVSIQLIRLYDDKVMWLFEVDNVSFSLFYLKFTVINFIGLDGHVSAILGFSAIWCFHSGALTRQQVGGL